MPDKVDKRKTFLINLAYFIAVVAIVYICFKYLISYILPFLIAFILVSIINPITRRLNKRFPKRRSIISFVLMVLLYVVIGGLVFSVVFAILLKLLDVAEHVALSYYPEILKPALLSAWDNIQSYIGNLPPEWVDMITNAQNNIMTELQSFVLGIAPRLMSLITGFTGSVPGFIIAFVFTIMLSFFVSNQYENVLLFFKAQLPPKVTNIIKDLRAIISSTVLKYLGAVLILMMITFVELSVGLWIIGVNGALVVAMGIAVLDALPVFGTGAAMIPWILVKLLQGEYQTAGAIAILYAVVTVVRNIIEPKVVGDRLGINPIVSMVAIYFGFKVFGVFGMIFMPMVAQIILELNRRGTISLFKSFEPIKSGKELKKESAVKTGNQPNKQSTANLPQHQPEEMNVDNEPPGNTNSADEYTEKNE